MALTVTLTGTTVILDETAGLQNNDTNTALPSEFSTRLAALLAPATEINHAVSNGDVITISGVTGSVGNVAFTDGSGGALDGDTSGLFTNDGEEIFLFTDPVNDNIVLGKTAAGVIAFAVYLEQTATGGKIWSVQYEALEHPDGTNPDDSLDLGSHLKVAVSEVINFGFAGAPSGSNLFMTFGDPTSTQIVVIGKDPLNQSQGGNISSKDVLNISQAGSTTSFGVNGNAINPGEGAYITYVTGANTNFLVPNLDQNEADVEANIDFQNVFNATSASFTVNQTNPGVGPVTVKISAFDTAKETGVNFVDGLTNDAHVNITSFSLTDVVVKSGKTQFTPQATIDNDGNLIVTGLSTGDKVQWTTGATHDRVLIENISATDGISGNDNNTFDIGGFGLSSANAASAVVGTAIHFEDDGPTAGIVQGAPTVAHDETAGNQSDADDTTAAGVVSLFAGVTNVSADLNPTGYAQDANAVVSSTGSSLGTDSVGGTIAFSLAVSAAGVDSGLDTTDGTSIFLFKEGSLVVGRIGGAAGAAAFAVAINSTSGVVSVAQYASLKHPTTTNPDDSVSITDAALLAVVTVTDGDGDTATSSTGIGDAVQFQDDGPTAAIVQGAATVAHDETAGNQSDADDTTDAAVSVLFAGVTNVSSDLSPAGFARDATPVVSSTGSSLGADQEGGTIAFSLAVSSAGVDSGLDTTGGTSVFLFKEGSLVVGRIGSSSGAAAFAVAINSSTGVVSVAQYASLKHPDATNPDDSVSITDSALLAVVTVTDGDGDTATSSTGIGDAVQFQDDGPTAGIAQGAPTVAHDETAGNQSDADDTTDAAVSALFAGVTNVSGDLNPTGYARDASAVVSSTGSSFGADQEGGTTSFSLAVSAAGVDSGLDTTGGTSIFLFKEGSLVVGRIGSSSGAAAFAVAINSSSGVVSVAQYASLKHPDATNPDDSVSITDSALLAVVTVTDGDGDTATSSTGIGDAVQFQDDGPTAGIVQGAPTVAHDETAGNQSDADDTTDATVSALFAGVTNVSGDLSPTGYARDASAVVSSTGSSFGADQEGGTIAFSLAVSSAGVDSGLDTTDGTSIFLFKEGSLVVGRIGGAAGAAAFAVAINSTSGVVSVAQYASLKHPDATNPDDSVSITDSALLAVVTVTDGDGDTATSSTGIGDAVQFQDDGPTAGIVQGAATVAHDETAGNQSDADDTTDATVSALFAGVTNVSADLSPTGYARDATPVVSSTGSSLGADQEGGTIAFSLAVSSVGVDSGLDTTGGASIFLFKEGSLVVGRIGSSAGAAAFAVAINSSTGVVSVAQYASLKHPTTTNPDDSVSITDAALLAVVTVTDGDGDTATSSTGIGDAVQFQDDGPTIGPIADGQVDFSALSTVTKTLAGVVGADDPATYSITSSPASLTILDGTVSQMTLLRDLSNSDTVATYYKDVDNSGTHNAGDIDFFKLTLSGGNYTFDVLQNPPPAEISFSFAGAPSGSNLFMTFGDPNSTQIVVVGENPLNQSQGGNITTKDVLNISQAGSTTSFGVNGNQLNDNANYPTEGAYITYVTGTNTNFLVPNLDQNEADVEANIDFQNVFNATGASFTVNQTNPGIGPVTVKITAFNTLKEAGVNFIDGLTNDQHVNITSASVTDLVVKTGNTSFTPVATIDQDGNLIITGLSTGDKVSWSTGATTHDRVLIENISAHDGIAGNDNNTFDIGGFSLIQSQPAPDEKLDFTVQIADADGDTASSSFSVKIDGNHDGVINV
ncbi:hypothetical protein JQ617_35470 [Bradyrhizobium sp. KB893862 SZCCT0404]|uniref:beta strand repeat-containing protein n=1 Tax=Bradyrhizobium sp. KB893862 SZCCT0404 TaxID=2807672 RepID=UPI001BAAB151|nr:DUF5801 repeats-in-toxin domain-containing protein [Bradyrhizobium sp. KB893862 SZCCT0404]MBR1179310.1 hypothetical protein [Bradyrhizobium sp. KB893862 SZCCT0404]